MENKINEIILCKYGEIALKGANHNFFENALVNEIRRRIKPFGEFSVTKSQSTIRVEPQEDSCDMDGAYALVKKIFGIIAVCRAYVAEKDMDDITRVVKAKAKELVKNGKTFKAEAKRADKTFPLTSPEISGEAGAALLSALPHLRVNVHNPDVTVRVEIREKAAYISANQEKSAGGLPIGTSGNGLLLLSGGIDSPVAGYMMAKRGVKLHALHFESMPYTSLRAREKVLLLAEELTQYVEEIQVHIISVTHIQEELREKCHEDYFTLLLRRFMMRLSQMTAEKYNCGALITGESLSQVASQTMAAIAVTNACCDLPVFRPLIGMDKEEIIRISREIGTFDTSVLPFEDCCTVFTPRHPKTKPDMEKVLFQESKVDVDALVKESFETLTTVYLNEREKREAFEF